MKRKKGYLLVTALMLLAAVAIFAAIITNLVSNIDSMRVIKEKLFMASNASMNGVQLGTSYLAHFSNVIGSFDLDFNGPGSVPFKDISWLQPASPNNYFNSIYSSIDGNAWKSALSTLATNANVLWLNKIPQVESFFETLKASGVLKVIPDIVVIQTKNSLTNLSKSKYFIVAHAVVGGMTAYSSGFVVANSLNKYVYFTQEEPPYSSPYYNVTFMTGDTLDGPARTNGTLVTLGTPDFNGYVEYGGLQKIKSRKYGSPNFESGASVLSSSDIASMNMSKIASDYSNQINSEVASPSAIKSAGVTSTPVGLDLSVVYDNLLNTWSNYGFKWNGNWWWNGKQWNKKYKWKKNGYYTLQRLTNMFKENFNNWLWWNNLLSGNSYTFDQLPKVIQNDYNNVIASIQGIPSLRISFSKGKGSNSGPTVTVEYAIDTTNAVNAVKHLQEDVNMYELSSDWLYYYFYDTSFYDVIQGYSNPNWQKLFTINPKPGNSVPGISQLVVNGNTAANLLGLENPNAFDFNFNGVIKTTTDLVVGDSGDTSVVSGKYTLYTTRSTVINGNIVYDYANQALGKNSSWISSPISSSDVAKIKEATGTDFLNIVSNYDVALNNTPKYLKIMASLYAFNGIFWYPNSTNTWHGKPGQMFVYGSMMQYEGGQLFGIYSGNSLASGYHAYYAFDWRILGGLPSNMYGTPSAKEKAILLSVRTVY